MTVMTRCCVLAGLCAAFMVVLVGCGGAGPSDFDPLPRTATVLAFGDSVTHGTGATRGEDFPARLADITGWRVVNDGVPGDRADTARERLGPSLREHEPDLVMIGLGGNDFLRQRAASAVKEDLRAMIHEVREQGAQPLLIGVPSVSAFAAATGRVRDDGIYDELAREEDVPLIGGVLSGVLSRSDLRADRIHPNAAGYRQMAEHIAESLEGLGLWLGP